MKPYQLIIECSRANEKVVMTMQASSSEAANDLAELLANQMPYREYYCQKNSRTISTGWFGYAEEANDNDKTV